MRGKEHVQDFDWVSDDRLVVTPAKREGALEQPVLTGELFGIDADGKGARMLFGYRQPTGIPDGGSNIRRPEAERASASVLHLLPEQENQVLVVVEPWDAEDAINEVRRMNVNTGATTRVVRAPIGRAGFVADRAGNVRLSIGTLTNQTQQIHRRPAAGGDWTLIHDEAEAGFKLRVLAFDGDGRTVLVSRQQPRGADALYRWDIEANTMAKVADAGAADPAVVLEGVEYMDAYAVVSHPDKPSITYLDDDAREARLTKAIANAFSGQHAWPTSFTRDGAMALVKVESDRNSGEFYLFDVASMRATFVGATREWLDPDQLGEVRPIVVPARDGRKLHGYLTLPPGREAEDLPMVVVPHGGPQARDYWLFDEESQLLASRGYAVLRLNFRGSTGYGADHEIAGYRQWGGTMQDDLADAVRWTVAQGLVDGDRVCIYGGSYGGYAAMMNAARYPDLYKCAVGFAGVYDLPLMYQDGDIRQSMFGRAYLDRVLGRENLSSASPVNLATQIKVPVMLAHGGQDARVPPAHAERMRKALRDAGNDPEWLFERTEGHGFYSAENKLKFYTQLVAFLDRHIGADATAAPGTGASD
jgi:dipeptidyl aminopeptidase/acylaminoacyl peptidase